MGGCTSNEELDKEYNLATEREIKAKELLLKIKYLSNTPFCLHLNNHDLSEFAGFFHLKILNKDEILIKQGEVAQELIIIGDGSIDIYHLPTHEEIDNELYLSRIYKDKQNNQLNFDETSKSDLKDIEVSISYSIKHRTGASFLPNHYYFCTKLPGDFLCESSFLSNQPVPSAYITSSESTILKLSPEDWNSFLQLHMEKSNDLLRIIGQKMETNLQTLPFLSKVPLIKLAIFANMFHYVPLRVGQVLFEAGSIGQSMYVVYSGKVKAHIFDKTSNNEIILSEINTGSFFGEISLLVDIPRTANITAVEDCLLLELRKSDCKQMMNLVPELHNAFDQLMKERTAEHFRHYDIPFFTSIPLDKYSKLAEMCVVKQYPPNTVIFHAGEIGDVFYIIAHGEISVRAIKGDTEVEVCKMGRGRYFGEISLVRSAPRSATVVTLDKCVIMSISKDNFSEFFESCPEALSDFHVKLARYDIALSKLIYHPLGRSFFTKYLESEFSAENIKFWLAAKQYREIPDIDQDARNLLGQEIYDKYIISDAAEQVNLNSKNLSFVTDNVLVKNFPSNLYVVCAEEILSLMSTDSFKRFKEGNLFQEFLKASDSYSGNETKLS